MLKSKSYNRLKSGAGKRTLDVRYKREKKSSISREHSPHKRTGVIDSHSKSYFIGERGEEEEYSFSDFNESDIMETNRSSFNSPLFVTLNTPKPSIKVQSLSLAKTSPRTSSLDARNDLESNKNNKSKNSLVSGSKSVSMFVPNNPNKQMMSPLRSKFQSGVKKVINVGKLRNLGGRPPLSKGRSPIKLPEVKKTKQNHCPLHPQRLIEYMCTSPKSKDCMMPICGVCAQSGHYSHRPKLLKGVSEEMKNQLSASSWVAEMHIESLFQQKEYVQNEGDHLLTNLQSEIDTYRAMIAKMTDTLLIFLQELTGSHEELKNVIVKSVNKLEKELQISKDKITYLEDKSEKISKLTENFSPYKLFSELKTAETEKEQRKVKEIKVVEVFDFVGEKAGKAGKLRADIQFNLDEIYDILNRRGERVDDASNTNNTSQNVDKNTPNTSNTVNPPIYTNMDTKHLHYIIQHNNRKPCIYIIDIERMERHKYILSNLEGVSKFYSLQIDGEIFWSGGERCGEVLLESFTFHFLPHIDNMIERKQDLTYPRCSHVMASKKSKNKRTIYCIGGHDGKKNLSLVERYTWETNTWKSIQPLNHARSSPAVVLFQERWLYVFGGVDGSMLDAIEYLDCSNKSSKTRWEIVLLDWSLFWTPRYGVGALPLPDHSRILLFGGGSSDVFLFTPEKKMIEKNNLPFPVLAEYFISSLGATLSKNGMYVVGPETQGLMHCSFDHGFQWKLLPKIKVPQANVHNLVIRDYTQPI